MLVLAVLAVFSMGSPPGVARAVEPAAASSVDPCSLLNSRQLHQRGLNAGVRQGAACVWKTIARAPWGGVYLAQLLQGSAPGGKPAPPILNRPTSEYTPPNLDPTAYCVYLVDLGAGVTLWAQYGGPDEAGISHTIACRKAQAGAADMISTYGTVPH